MKTEIRWSHIRALATGLRRKQRRTQGTLLIVALSPITGRAQQDAGVLRVYQAGVEVGRETFRDAGRTLFDTLDLPAVRQRIVSFIERTEDGRPIRAERRFFSVNSLVLTISAVLDNDTLRTTWTPANRSPRDVASNGRLDAILPDEASVAPILSLLQRAPRQDRTWQVRLLTQDSTVAMGVAWRGDTAVVDLGSVQLVAQLGANDTIAQVLRPAGEASYVIAISPVRYERFTGPVVPALRSLDRPILGYDAPADAPYVTLDVRVPARTSKGAAFSIGCTLTRPKSGESLSPAVITINGSGPGDRDDDTWPLLTHFHLYRQVADRLARAGIAVLRCDKRGFGASMAPADTGSYLVWYADDAAAELAFLRARTDVDPLRLGVVGHSLGGMIGPMVAARDPQLAALVVMAGQAKALGLFVRDQFLYPAEHTAGLSDSQREVARQHAISSAVAYANRGALRVWRDHDPLETATHVRQPVLILHGESDRNLSVGQADTLAAALRAGGNADVTVRRFAGLNHFLLVTPSGTGSFEEYGTLTDTAVPAEVLNVLANWLAAKFRR